MHKLYPLPIPVLVFIGGIVSGIVGLGMGYLTLRLRGAFFAIATLALAVVLQTLIVNWDFVGGSRGAYIVRPEAIWPFGAYIQYLFLIMMLLAIGAITVARLIERSRLGYGFATIRDDELAAEASGVPTLRLKLIATTISGALMGMAGAPFPYYIGFLQPSSAFGLDYAVNSIAMPLIGGTTSWVGPLIGAILLGSLQQIATVTISSAVNLLDRRLPAGGLCDRRAEWHCRAWCRNTSGIGRSARSAAAAGSRPTPRDTFHDGYDDGYDDHCSKRRHGRAARRRQSRQAFRRLCRARRHLAFGESRRTGRPHRPQRLGQEHAGQLHLRHAAERGRLGHFRRPSAQRHERPSAHPPRTVAHVSTAAAVRELEPRRQYAHSADLYGGRRAAPRQSARRRSRRVASSSCARSASRAKPQRLPRELTQVEMRKLELARAMAAEPKLLIADESMAGLTHSEVEEILALLMRLNAQGVTIILIEHIMSAVMSFSQRLVVLVSGRKIADGEPNAVMRDPEVERAYLGQ